MWKIHKRAGTHPVGCIRSLFFTFEFELNRLDLCDLMHIDAALVNKLVFLGLDLSSTLKLKIKGC